jgi:hypothetical protein
VAVLHNAWLKFRPETTPERIEQHMQACRALVGVVPAVINLQCGRSFANRSDDYTHCIIVTLADRAAIPQYLEHPEHIKVVTPLKEDVAELMVMDVEV